MDRRFKLERAVLLGLEEVVLLGEKEVRLRRGSRTLMVDGQEKPAGTSFRLEKDGLKIPAAAICASMGWTLAYCRDEQAAYLLPGGREFHLYARGRSFFLIVANPASEPLEYVFDSGRVYDLVLKKDGQVIWRRSRDRVWTQMVSRRVLPPGECWVFSAAVTGTVPPGEYLLEAYFDGWSGSERPADLSPRPAAHINIHLE